MRTLGAVLVAVFVLGCGCDEDDGAHDSGRPPPSEPIAPSAQQQMVREWLRAQAISDTQFGVPVLYTWLAPEDEAALRAGGSIATTTATDPHALDAVLAADASDVANHLREPGRAGRQRAWSSPWAARRAFAADGAARLARIELRPESVVLVYDARHSPPDVRFSTERGAAAPFDDAVLVPDLWAAVLVVGEDRADDGSARPWRQYVLVNATMIGRVSIGSPEIQAELRIERERLTALGHDVGAGDAALAPQTLEASWAAVPDADATTEQLFAAACMDARNVLGQRALLDLVGTLVDRGDTFEWRTELPSEPRPQLRE